MNPDKAKGGLSRRDFLKSLIAAPFANNPILSMLPRHREDTAHLSEAPNPERERYDVLLEMFRNPLRTIDGACERISFRLEKKFSLSAGEDLFYSAFRSDSQDADVKQRREILAQVYPQLAEKIARLLANTDTLGVTDLFQMGSMLWQPLLNIQNTLDYPENQPGLSEFEHFKLLQAIEWITPLHDHSDYLTQKKTYLPTTSQAERISKNDAPHFQEAMKIVRNGEYDAEWYLRLVQRDPSKRSLVYEQALGITPEQFIEWNVRMASQEDIDLNSSALKKIDDFLPFALVPMISVKPENLTSPVGIRAYHDYWGHSIHMGSEYPYVASVEYARKHNEIKNPSPDAIEQSLGTTLQKGLFVQLHETFHGYDVINPRAAEYKHLHPLDVLNYSLEYASFHKEFQRFVDSPTSSDIAFRDKDFNAIFFAKSLSIVGLDEISSQNPDQMNRLSGELSFLRDVLTDIEALKLSPDVFEKFGLGEFFNSKNEPMQIWKTLLRAEATGFYLPMSVVLAKCNTLLSGNILKQATGLHSSHLSQLLETITFIAQDQDNLAVVEKDQALYELLEIKSHYLLIVYSALSRIREHFSDGLDELFSPLYGNLFDTRVMIYGHLHHCMVGPAGEYVPSPRYLSTRSLEKSQSEQVADANRSADEAFQQIQVEYAEQFTTDTPLPELRQKQMRELIWNTLVRIQNSRLKLLGADISPAAEKYRRRGMGWMNADRNDYTQLYRLMLQELGSTLGIDKFS